MLLLILLTWFARSQKLDDTLRLPARPQHPGFLVEELLLVLCYDIDVVFVLDVVLDGC